MAQLNPVAAEALKKWDGGHSSMGSLGRELNPSPVLGSRVLPPENFLKIYM